MEYSLVFSYLLLFKRKFIFNLRLSGEGNVVIGTVNRLISAIYMCEFLSLLCAVLTLWWTYESEPSVLIQELQFKN